MMKKPLLIYPILAAVLCVGVALGWFIPFETGMITPPAPTEQIRVNLPQYRFINPPLFSESAKSNDPRFAAFAASVGSYVDSSEKDGLVSSASIYFRDLDAAEWTGMNEDALYTPSSMMKVVAMMAVLKLAESDPSLLDMKVPYHQTPPDETAYYFNDKNNLPGGMYTLREMIGSMIKYSDNDALDAIVKVPEVNSEFVEAYSLFRLPLNALSGSTTDFMSPRSFSSVFRTLYNSSFFSWDLSEQVLDLLSQTTFTRGIVGGVPTTTPVAHKFGENVGELHDCGIVYYPGHPYLLCVMTRGSVIKNLGAVIREVSKMSWDFVSRLYPTSK